MAQKFHFLADIPLQQLFLHSLWLKFIVIIIRSLGNKKFWLYGAALIPPVTVGYLRIKAMRHFPTDVITGLAVGAAVGILVPHLHKTKKKPKSNYSFIPFVGDMNGLKIRFNAIRLLI